MNAKVLFVDDDEGNLVVCEAHCSAEFDVLLATSAEQALHLLETETDIGVIVADQRMPGESGVELLEKVRQRHPDVVRMLITAYSDLSAAILAINRGQVRRYLKKPWDPEELKAELRDALDVYDMKMKLRALGTRLREAEKVYSLGVVAAGIAHELNNPISWVQAAVELMKCHRQALEKLIQGTPLAPDAAPLLDKLRDSLEKAEGGVTRLFDIVRGVSLPLRSRPPGAEVIDVGETLRVTLELVGAELRDTAVLDSVIETRAFVVGSVTKVSQVLLNLIVNAMQALQSGPLEKNRIRVALTADASFAYVVVADSGPGVPEADRERIFEPFFTTKAVGGMGLGLPICRQIADELGGSLEVSRDENLGGARFCLKLPLHRNEAG